ncbi:TetR family transcriptional regulator [Kribbella sp. NBC_01510]|uniref:TetR/AcrR family transcriptional regulator n=1 Tax=Kribbella sp. NBC_01510 TaxID=2903581 RepID=UPI003866C27A
MPPGAEHGLQARERLLSTAIELVPERGWSAVSTRILAERAGVSPSVVHYHFSSMPALLGEAVVTAMRGMLAEASALLEAAETPAEIVDRLVGSVDQYTGADPMSLLFVEAYLASTRDDDLRRQIVAEVDGFRSELAASLANRGVPAAEATAAVLSAAIDGLVLHRGLGAGPDTAASARLLRRLVTDIDGG